MNAIQLLYSSLRKPVTILVAVIAIVFFSVVSIKTMPVDIFPKLGTPVIYVAQTYGGLSAEQIEGFVTSYYEYHFLFVTGIKSVESKTIQGVTLLKLNFYDGTDMGQATGEVVAMVNRARAFMPPGTVSPFITRFDGGSVAVGQLVFSSPNRSLAEVSDLALFKVRPMFSTLPGVSAPPPFGGNQRSVLIKADPNKMRSYGISAEELVTAVAKGNTILPAGNLRTGDQMLIVPQNTVVDNIQDLGNIPVKTGSGPAVYVHDLAQVDNGGDVTTGYALINGKRSVYIPVTKRADASTWEVVQKVKAALPDMQAAIPADIRVTYEFDQSGYVINSLKSLLTEGILGAVLTGVMVLLFLGDWRGSLIVVLTIPLALLSAIIFLKLFGQTINIMTLGGLALAIGILVDEATVTIENIHHHQEKGELKGRAILEACKEVALPKLLILLCILAVFVPAFFMSGIPKAMFLPLSLAVSFAMIASFLLSQSFVPVLANWLLKEQGTSSKEGKRMTLFKVRHERLINRLSPARNILIPVYMALSIGLAVLLFFTVGKELFPKVDAGQFQVRIRLKEGTRIERTESTTKLLLHLMDSISGSNKISISSAYVGLTPSSYPVSAIHLWTSGPEEAVLKVKFIADAGIHLEGFKESVRKVAHTQMPDVHISFEPADLVEQVMSQGTGTPVQIQVLGKSLLQDRQFGKIIVERLKGLPYLRDVAYSAPQGYPALKIEFDRVKLGQLGLTIEDAGKSLADVTSSSRFTQPNYWVDKSAGTAYQVQVQVPEMIMNDPGQVDNILLSSRGGKQIYLRDVATWRMGNIEGEFDRLNQKRFITITANLQGAALGTALTDIDNIISRIGPLPQGMKIQQQGQAEVFLQTFQELQRGLLLAIVIIFLLLAVNFQSFRLSLIIIGIVPGIIAGSLLLLVICGKSLNIQSYMGCIMAIGVAIANAILFVTQAEKYRREKQTNPYLPGIKDRIRPILMTSLAMIAGMMPMSLGLGEGGDQTSPLGTAVIGGLVFSMFSSLIVLPLIYQAFIGNKLSPIISLDPDDPKGQYHLLINNQS